MWSAVSSVVVPPIAIGEVVQTGLGKGIVRQVRRHGRLVVEVKGRALELDERAVARLDEGGGRKGRAPASLAPVRSSGGDERAGSCTEVDLHGLTVDEALARIDVVMNDALLSDRAEVRLIHGRSGGRIRAALHRRLREIGSVRAFHLDPHNPGVTIVIL
jgi:dsDNA-specific endonuclease/ATPase MutS2